MPGAGTPLGKIIRVGRNTAAAAVPWYLAGGVSVVNCLAAYQPVGAISQAASYTNLATSGGAYNAAPGVAPTWTAADGWIGDGAAWLTTNVNAVVTYTYIVRFSALTANGVLFGCSDGAGTLEYERFGAHYYANSTDAAVGTAPTDGAGVVAIAGKSAYLDGVLDKTLGAGNPPNTAVYVLGRDDGGPANALSTAKIQALAIYNITLTAGQVAAITAAMAAL